MHWIGLEPEQVEWIADRLWKSSINRMEDDNFKSQGHSMEEHQRQRRTPLVTKNTRDLMDEPQQDKITGTQEETNVEDGDQERAWSS